MIQDKLTLVDDGATVTGGTTTVSVSAVDVGTVDRALGTGKPLYLNFVVTAKSGGDGSDTFRFDAIQSANADLSAGSVIASSRTITGIANIPVGFKVSVEIPQAFLIAGRYIGAGYAVTADAVLTVDAWFSDTPVNDITAYDDGI